MTIRVLPDATALAQAAAEHVAAVARAAAAARGRFSIALSGGSTPKALYARLAADPLRSGIDWSTWYVFWGDERSVPPDDPASNARMAGEALLSHVPIPRSQVFRVLTELGPEAAAAAYERTLREQLGPEPRFDLILLGMGDDGHTASLFPGTAPIHETTRLVVAHYVPKLDTNRITLTPPVINNAAHITFVVSGAAKADRLREVLEGPRQVDVLPSQVVAPTRGELLWLIDRDAASKLTPGQ